MSLLGTVHLGTALLSLGVGLAVALLPKGTRRHVLAGRVYLASMLTVNVTALLIYDLFGGFGPFHVAAILSLITIVMGMLPARSRRPRKLWIARHAYWMSGSYVGLVAAAVSETVTRRFALPMGPSVAIATLLVSVVGVVIILRRVPVALRRFGFGTARPSATGGDFA